jgi:WD40 repeat protein
VVGDDDGKVQTWDIATRRPLRELAPAAAPKIYAIAVSPEGSRAVTSHDDNDARIWDLASGRLLATLAGHRQPVFAIAWAPDGRRVATCGNDGTAMIWDAANGNAIRTLALGSDCPGIAFDGDGQQLATASRQIAQVWSADGQPIGAYESREGIVTSVMFGPPGLLVTTAGDSIRIWDLDTRQPLESFSHPEPVTEADISGDRSMLAARSGSRVYLWRLAPGVAAARVRAIVDALPLTLQGGVVSPQANPRLAH